MKTANLPYQQLLDEMRQELAQRHLRDPFLSTTDIAFLLGYFELSVFVRSFKRWAGVYVKSLKG
ncbi:helix-turn-helix domain-containing protein [Hymenobacter cavernae]|nr:helix-turn-helix domain-containing protein [Hymenobacter cavernae]